MTSTVALVPARAGSVRVPNKNIRELGGKPLIVWTIEAAQQAGLDDVYVSSDSERIGEIAKAAGAVWIQRPPQYSTSESPDIEWVQHALSWMKARDISPDILANLRPTSPFRDAGTVRGALARFLDLAEWPAERRVDSLRGIRPVTEHPFKTWKWLTYQADSPSNPIVPFLPGETEGVPWHSSQTNTLTSAYVQTAGLELVWREAVERTGKISGDVVHGYLLEGAAALDINTEQDFNEAEQMLAAPLAAPVFKLSTDDPPPLPPSFPPDKPRSTQRRLPTRPPEAFS